MSPRIVDFEPRHADAWRSLNEAWIRRWFSIEPKDRLLLDEPEKTVIGRGGRIFIAEHSDGTAVGCVALLPMPDGGYELLKMAVAEAARGAGLGRRLIEACVEAARAAGGWRLYLETSSRLGPALQLYRSVGFGELDPADIPPTEYERCDIWMELKLTPEPK